MNTILNISAFLKVARLGSFSAAAREMDAATSVIAKRISQLEKEVRAKLITRSTRGVTLSAAGERHLPQFVRLIAAYEEAFNCHQGDNRRIEGFLRIISPPTVTSLFLGPLFTQFQLAHPGVDMDIVAMERSVNPLEEGFDIGVGGWPISYPDVIDVSLCRYELVTVCAPQYLKGKQAPRHPTELVDHSCVTTTLFRTSWAFSHPRGSVKVEVHSRMQASDSRMVRDAARKGLGIAILPCILVEEDLRAGTLVPVLEEFPVAAYWLKLLVPRMKLHRPAVSALVRFLKESVPPGPP
ncbi:MAG: LysR family transcriptional regulator [Gammaproteobacteria bacterium]